MRGKKWHLKNLSVSVDLPRAADCWRDLAELWPQSSRWSGGASLGQSGQPVKVSREGDGRVRDSGPGDEASSRCMAEAWTAGRGMLETGSH